VFDALLSTTFVCLFSKLVMKIQMKVLRN